MSDKDASAPINPFDLQTSDPFARKEADPTAPDSRVHLLGSHFRCDTDQRGFATPNNDSRLKIVVDATEGFIPLWASNVQLRWTFRESSFEVFANPKAAQDAVRILFGEALLLWGDAVPIKFSENSEAWDFEFVMKASDDCAGGGCVLASAFFPDAGRHQLDLYPVLFQQSRQEIVETLAHEFGHVFGLRHFFAQITEQSWRSEIFGNHQPFSIMNYGTQSVMTANDQGDLKTLYALARSGALTEINGTPIKLVHPYHTLGLPC